MRQHITKCVLILLASAALCGRAQTRGSASPGVAHFIAATPAQQDMPQRYPAALYAVGERQKLLLVRQLFTADQRFLDIADDLHGKIYLAGSEGVFVIHEEDPGKEDFVPLESFDDFPCWGAVEGDHVPAAVQYCIAGEIRQVLGNQEPGKPRVGPGSWEMFKFMQYGGENGGPFQMLPPLAEIAGLDLVMPYALGPRVVLAHLPSELNTNPEKRRRVVQVVAATDRYFALWIVPDYMMGHSVSTNTLDHAEPLQLFVLDRSTDKWRTLEVATAVTSITRPPIRMFGDWMVTTIMNWSPASSEIGGGSPGRENERVTPSNSAKPNIRSRYSNHFAGLYIPGKLVIQNLADERKIALNTGQEDSEVLAIRADGEILYRVNDSIYSATMKGNQITAPTLITKGDDVPDVHWAFWGPKMESGKSQPETK